MIRPNKTLSRTVLIIGFLFLYIPIVGPVVYSFNESKLVTAWSGFSLKWYGVLFHDNEMLVAALLSLKLAVIAATASLIAGTWAGFVLARMGRFWGYTFFTGMINAPLVIPIVIQGISLLLLFVSMKQIFGWPENRGLLTMAIGHVMLCMSFVAIVIRSRLTELNKALEEAAFDLGARPFKVFFVITLPLISQALLSGWLLSFTVSIDDVILSAFLSGPGYTTLPLVIFSRVRLGLNPEMNALATLFMVCVTVGVVIANWVTLRNERRKAMMQ